MSTTTVSTTTVQLKLAKGLTKDVFHGYAHIQLMCSDSMARIERRPVKPDEPLSCIRGEDKMVSFWCSVCGMLHYRNTDFGDKTPTIALPCCKGVCHLKCIFEWCMKNTEEPLIVAAHSNKLVIRYVTFCPSCWNNMDMVDERPAKESSVELLLTKNDNQADNGYTDDVYNATGPMEED